MWTGLLQHVETMGKKSVLKYTFATNKPTSVLDHFVATTTLEATVAFVTLLVIMLTSSPVTWREKPTEFQCTPNSRPKVFRLC